MRYFEQRPSSMLGKGLFAQEANAKPEDSIRLPHHEPFNKLNIHSELCMQSTASNRCYVGNLLDKKQNNKKQTH